MRKNNPLVLTVRDVAKIFSVPEREVYRWVEEGGLPAWETRETYRFDPSELLEWATARNMKVPPGFLPATSSAGLAEALESGGIHYGLPGGTRGNVLHALIDQITALPPDDRAILSQILESREDLGCVGIGKGIAIPHVRHPAVLAEDHALLALAFLADPLDMKGPDGQDVDTLFLLISPDVGAHLQWVAKLATALREPSFLEAIRGRRTADEIIQLARCFDDARPLKT